MFNKSKNSFLYLSGTNAFMRSGNSGNNASNCLPCGSSGPPKLNFRSIVWKYPVGLQDSFLPHLQDESPLKEQGHWGWDDEGNPKWIPNDDWGPGGGSNSGDAEKDRWYKEYFGKLKWPNTGRGPNEPPLWDPDYDQDEPTTLANLLERFKRIFLPTPSDPNKVVKEYGGLILEGWGNYDLTDPVAGSLDNVIVNIGQKISKPFIIKGTYHTHTNDTSFSLEDILELWRYAYYILTEDPDNRRFSEKQIHVLITPNYTYTIEIDNIWNFFEAIYNTFGFDDILDPNKYGDWDIE